MGVTAELLVGAQAKLAPTPYDASNRPLSGRAFAYSSSAPSIATVDANGVVTGVAIGVAIITATVEGESASTTVRVVPQIATVVASRVVITPPGPATSLAAGQTLQLAAVPSDANGNPLSNAGLGWVSSNPAVATVGAATGLVTGVAIGTAVITAAVAGLQATLTLNVTQALDGSLADARAVIPDGEHDHIHLAGVGQTLSGGNGVATWADARGAGFENILLIGNGAPLPQYDAGHAWIRLDGSQNSFSTQSIWQFDLSRERTDYVIASFEGGGFPVAILQDASIGATSIQLRSDGTNLSGASPSGSVSLGLAQSATARLAVMSVSTPLRGPSTNGPFAAFDTPNRLRRIIWENPMGTGTKVEDTGRMGGTANFAASNLVARGSLNKNLTLAKYQALQRLAVARGAVIPVDKTRALLGIGDSRMRGFNTTNPLTDNFLAVAAASLAANWDWTNWGHDGMFAAEIQALIETLLKPTLDSSIGKIVVVGDFGVNDAAANYSAQSIINAHIAVGQAVLAAGHYYVPCAMMTDFGFNGAQEAVRLTVNAAQVLGASQGWATKFFDSTIYSNPGQSSPPNADSVDGLHENTTAAARRGAGLLVTVNSIPGI